MSLDFPQDRLDFVTTLVFSSHSFVLLGFKVMHCFLGS